MEKKKRKKNKKLKEKAGRSVLGKDKHSFLRIPTHSRKNTAARHRAVRPGQGEPAGKNPPGERKGERGCMEKGRRDGRDVSPTPERANLPTGEQFWGSTVISGHCDLEKGQWELRCLLGALELCF